MNESSAKAARRPGFFCNPQSWLSRLLPTVTAGVFLATPVGWAQTTPASSSAEPAGNANELGEVVVTAQRRAIGLEEVPVAVSALTGDELTSRHLVNLDDIVTMTPDVTFNTNHSDARINIREIGNNLTSLQRARRGTGKDWSRRA